MSHPIHGIATAPMHANQPNRTLPRWLLVAGTVALIGVGIDLFRGPPASALPAPTTQLSTFAAVPLDHAVTATLVDPQALEPGGSVANYDLSAEDAQAPVPAPAAEQAIADDTLAPGASIAAYER